MVETTSFMDQERLIERRAHGEAIWLLEEVARCYPLTATTLFDVRRRIADLEAHRQETAQRTPFSVPSKDPDAPIGR